MGFLYLVYENVLLWILNPHVIVIFPGSFILAWFSQCLKYVLSQSGLHLSHVMRKTDFCLCQKGADQLHSNCVADQHTDIKIPLLLKSKISLIQASFNPLWLYRLVFVGPDQKPQRPVSL